MTRTVRGLATPLAVGVTLLVLGGPAFASDAGAFADGWQGVDRAQPESAPSDTDIQPHKAQLETLRAAVVALPVAALLGAVLAFRPRRRGTPVRSPAVIQTQIILAIVGAVIMLVVGASLARAFGIAGAASLIRYRAKIDDPKDAGVMLSTLAVGLASGVGLYGLAAFATVFIGSVLWLIESLEPAPTKIFTLTIKAKAPAELRPKIEDLLRRITLAPELRSSSAEEICYEVKVPAKRKIDRISDAILKLDPKQETAVEWQEKTAKKK